MHDELVIEAREDVMAAAACLTRHTMESALQLALPPGEAAPGALSVTNHFSLDNAILI